MSRPTVSTLAAFAAAVMLTSVAAIAQEVSPPVVRVADLEIDPAQLDAYTAVVREEMSTSIQIEPGVLAINCVGEKDAPHRLHFFEVYADVASYESHIASPHFRKYVDLTKNMITSHRLTETIPVQMSAKKNS